MDRILQQNNINRRDIGTSISMKQVCLTLTENYLRRQGVMKDGNNKDEETS